MTDLYACHCKPGMFHDLKQHKSASPADLLAAVRRGVESGTIEGEVAECLECNGVGRVGPIATGNDTWTYVQCEVCQGAGLLLVIPVSDGGEDRP